jgi:virginiamycin B lyase
MQSLAAALTLVSESEPVSLKHSNFLIFLVTALVLAGPPASSRASNISKPGIKAAQIPYSSIKPTATLKIGGTADWVLVTEDALWVAGTKPFAVVRIDPATNKIVASIRIPGEACSGLASRFGSIWVPICGKKPALVRIDEAKNAISDILPTAPAAPEGGIAASDDSVWLVADKNGTLLRIDPSTNRVRQKIPIPSGSYNPIFSDGTVWITGIEKNVLTAVDASSGKVVESITVGPKPRFLTAGAGSIWTLNQGDGTISRVDENSRKLVITISVGIPGTGGDVAYGANSVWLSVFDVPLTRIDATSNRVVKQWVGKGGDSLRIGFDSLWITDYKKGLLFRIPVNEVQ